MHIRLDVLAIEACPQQAFEASMTYKTRVSTH